MAKRTQGEGEEIATAENTDTTEPRPPQGLTPRFFDTGRNAIDFHRMHQPAQGVPGIRRIDPASLRNEQGHDPWLRYPNGAVVQLLAEHAAELLECNPTGGPSDYRLATDAEIEQEKARQKASLRRR